MQQNVSGHEEASATVNSNYVDLIKYIFNGAYQMHDA